MKDAKEMTRKIQGKTQEKQLERNQTNNQSQQNLKSRDLESQLQWNIFGRNRCNVDNKESQKITYDRIGS